MPEEMLLALITSEGPLVLVLIWRIAVVDSRYERLMTFIFRHRDKDEPQGDAE